MSVKWLMMVSILILLLAAFGGISLFSAADGLKGDVNGDGYIDISQKRIFMTFNSITIPLT